MALMTRMAAETVSRQEQNLVRMTRMAMETVLRQERDLARTLHMIMEPMLQQQDLMRMARMVMEPALKQQQDLALMTRIATEQISSIHPNLGRVSHKMMDETQDQLKTAPMFQSEMEQMPRKVNLIQKKVQVKPLLLLKPNYKGENWAVLFGWYIPRRYRNDIVGDILEDCAEMSEAGCTERRIKFHVVYQWLIAVITLVPMAVKCSITDILRQVISPPK
ncbi:MAG: hypothetical protein JXA81_02070 [Sedimentisphaerales bacterium]|nr:hypothetical protein [Sedimentisphaerales bacterium]